MWSCFSCAWLIPLLSSPPSPSSLLYFTSHSYLDLGSLSFSVHARMSAAYIVALVWLSLCAGEGARGAASRCRNVDKVGGRGRNVRCSDESGSRRFVLFCLVGYGIGRSGVGGADGQADQQAGCRFGLARFVRGGFGKGGERGA
ncbi:hypothetical protein BKA80DRAFT_35519 [Phyllosticta citrichinensis]